MFGSWGKKRNGFASLFLFVLGVELLVEHFRGEGFSLSHPQVLQPLAPHLLPEPVWQEPHKTT